MNQNINTDLIAQQKYEDQVKFLQSLQNSQNYQTSQIHQCGQYDGNGRYIYGVFHTVLVFIAIYLTFKCNKGFEIWSFLAALFFPHFYIIYILATQGTCGIIE